MAASNSFIGNVQPYMFEPPEPDEPDEVEQPQMQPRPLGEWCTCGKCRPMPNVAHNICCKAINVVLNKLSEQPEELECMTLHPGIEPVCLNPYSLQNALNIYQADHGPLPEKERFERARYLAYRSFVSWVWGPLKPKDRRILPSCIVQRIHEEYPDEDSEYTGFRPAI